MTLHVLIVDDDPSICRMIERTIVVELAWTCSVAHDVATAFARLDAIPPHARAIVVSDLDLRDPDGDGADVLLGARLDRPDAKCVLMSGSGGARLAQAAARAEAHATLEKPFSARALLDTLRAIEPPRRDHHPA